MKVSIVIPVFNTERYLEKCIQSAINQSYSDIEIIAVDDGSTDNSTKILEKFQDKIIILKKENGGTASALNAGIKIMKGEWFKWLSSDDILKKDAVEVLISEAKKLGEDAKSCIFYSNYDIIDNSGNKIGENIQSNYNNLTKFEQNVILLDHFYGNGTTSLMHKSIFKRCGLFDEKIGFKDDYEFWLRCCVLYGYTLHLIPKNLAKYRVHEQQLTKKKFDVNLKQSQTIKSFIQKQILSDQKTKYLEALREYQKQKPLNVRIRRQIRDVMFRILPKSASNKILETYLNKKKY